MATELTPASISPGTHYRQALQPVYASAVFAGDDSDNHDYIVAGRGKAKFTGGVHNATNKTVTVQLYGAPAADAEVGDAGVMTLGSSFTATTGTNAFATITDVFPSSRTSSTAS